jgi:hypothetical protein
VKVNAVVQRGVNDDEIVDLARFGRDDGVEVRFIEFMPLDADGGWRRDQVVSQDEIVARIAEVFPLEQLPARGAAPADRWRYLDGGGTVGVIPSVTSRSAGTATGCGSPPKASSAPVCSRPVSSICVRSSAAVVTKPIVETHSQPRSSGRSAPSGPVTRSVRSPSSGRIGR